MHFLFASHLVNLFDFFRLSEPIGHMFCNGNNEEHIDCIVYGVDRSADIPLRVQVVGVVSNRN